MFDYSVQSKSILTYYLRILFWICSECSVELVDNIKRLKMCFIIYVLLWIVHIKMWDNNYMNIYKRYHEYQNRKNQHIHNLINNLSD